MSAADDAQLRPATPEEPPADASTPGLVPSPGTDPRAQAARHMPQRASDIVARNSGVRAGENDAATSPANRNPLTAPAPGNAGTDPSAGTTAGRPGAAGPARPGSPAAPGGLGSEAASPNGSGRPPRQGLRSAATGAATGALGGPEKGLPSVPPGDTLREKAAHGAGQAAGRALDEAARGYAASMGVPPPVYEAAKRAGKRLANSRAGRKVLERSPVWRALPRSFKNGLTGNADASATGTKAGSGKRRAMVAGGLLVPLTVVLLVVALLAAHSSPPPPPVQPDAKSDSTVSAYLPQNWERLLVAMAAGATFGRPPYAQVPWTILAGLVQAQTDFGRYSPYDSIDRDPGRAVAEITPGGQSGGPPGGTSDVSAGPGPISAEQVAAAAYAAGFRGQDLVAAVQVAFSESGWNPSAHNSCCYGLWQINLSVHSIAGNWQNPIDNAVAAKRIFDAAGGSWCSTGVPGQESCNPWQSYGNARFTSARGQAEAAVARLNKDLAAGRTPEQIVGVSPRGGTVAPALFDDAGGGAFDGAATGAGVFADGCPIPAPSPAIGGQGSQGVGPYLLTPAAAADMRKAGADPDDPCASSLYVAVKLSAAAATVYAAHGRLPITTGTAGTGGTGYGATPPTTNYPWAGLTYHDGGDGWGMYYGQCVSYVAWMIYQNNGGRQRPPASGAAGWFPSDGRAKNPVTGDWGNAGDWNVSAARAGFTVNNTPTVGSVAQWENGSNGFAVGHVAYITAVNADGSIDMTQYNLREDSRFSTLHMPRGGATDTANGHAPYFVKWPDHFLHIYDDRLKRGAGPTSSGGATPATTPATTPASTTPTALHPPIDWVPNGGPQDMENAREYWRMAIDVTGIFADRSADPGRPCALPPPDDPDKPWSVGFEITYIWRCETDRTPSLYLVTGVDTTKGHVTYTVENDRYAAAQTLVSEALSVSYGAGRWKTGKCDGKAAGRQGIFPMTEQEAAAAGVTDRCDQEQNIDGAARLVLSVEMIPPEQRDHRLGTFQPMAGGWQKLGIAMGQDLATFAAIGPGDSFTPTDACTTVMTRFLTSIAPYAADFASLTKPPVNAERVWAQRLGDLETAHHVTDPADDPACAVGSWSPGYHAALSQIATGLAGHNGADAAALRGLANYYQAAEHATGPVDPVPGKDTLVVPRLATRPLKPVQAPIAPDTTEVWSKLNSGVGLNVPLDRLAVDYAWFYGGVIPPFNSAGRLIGSLANGSDSTGGTVQVSVGPDGCPENAPPNTLLGGSDRIGVHKLCADSVAQARTPQAAMAIKWALSSLGWPYTQDIPARTTGRSADCSSFVSRAYRDSGAIPHLFSGNAPTADVFRRVAWVHRIPFSQAQPGDLVEPDSGHVVLHLADGYNVQESDFGEVSHVLREYTSAYWAGWVDASKA